MAPRVKLKPLSVLFPFPTCPKCPADPPTNHQTSLRFSNTYLLPMVLLLLISDAPTHTLAKSRSKSKASSNDIRAVIPPGVAGYYRDDGRGQTIRDEITRQDAEAMESQILDFLGIPQPNVQTMAKRSLVPDYMFDIYTNLHMEEGSRASGSGEISDTEGSKSGKGRGSGERRKSRTDVSIHHADTIISFPNKAEPTKYAGRTRFRRYVKLYFDLSKTSPRLYRLQAAELKIYKSRHSAKSRQSSKPQHGRQGSQSQGPMRYKLSLYVPRRDSGRIFRPMNLRRLYSVVFTGTQRGWTTFRLNAVVRRWMQKPRTNQGLYMTVLNLSTGRKVAPDEAGIIITAGPIKHRPFLVGYLKTLDPTRRRRVRKRPHPNELRPFSPSPTIDKRTKNRHRHQKKTSDKQKKGHQSSRSHSRQTDRMGRYKRSVSHVFTPRDYALNSPFYDYYARRPQDTVCQKRSLYVNFAEIGWKSWIIAPSGFSAFYCQGECTFPMSTKHLNATQHAIVQNLVNINYPGRLPKPCCAPQELSSMHVLYMDEEGQVILKVFRNMVVKSCSCH